MLACPISMTRSVDANTNTDTNTNTQARRRKPERKNANASTNTKTDAKRKRKHKIAKKTTPTQARNKPDRVTHIIEIPPPPQSFWGYFLSAGWGMNRPEHRAASGKEWAQGGQGYRVEKVHSEKGEESPYFCTDIH